MSWCVFSLKKKVFLLQGVNEVMYFSWHVFSLEKTAWFIVFLLKRENDVVSFSSPPVFSLPGKEGVIAEERE